MELTLLVLPDFSVWANRPRAGNMDKRSPLASFTGKDEHKEEFLPSAASVVCLDEEALAKLKTVPLLSLLETPRAKLGLSITVTT